MCVVHLRPSRKRSLDRKLLFQTPFNTPKPLLHRIPPSAFLLEPITGTLIIKVQGLQCTMRTHTCAHTPTHTYPSLHWYRSSIILTSLQNPNNQLPLHCPHQQCALQAFFLSNPCDYCLSLVYCTLASAL